MHFHFRSHVIILASDQSVIWVGSVDISYHYHYDQTFHFSVNDFPFSYSRYQQYPSHRYYAFFFLSFFFYWIQFELDTPDVFLFFSPFVMIIIYSVHDIQLDGGWLCSILISPDVWSWWEEVVRTVPLLLYLAYLSRRYKLNSTEYEVKTLSSFFFSH